MTQTTAPVTVTLELTFDEAFALKSALVDSSCYWHQLWRDSMEGKRPELNPDSCLKISKRAQEFYNKLEELGVVA